MTGTHLVEVESGTTLKVNFDALDNIISEFNSDISELVQSKEYVVTNIIELENQFSVDTFIGIKEKLSGLNQDINKIAEKLNTFNDCVRQSKAYYEKMYEKMQGSNTVLQNKSTSENIADVDSSTTIKTFENIELKYDEAYNVVDDYLTKRKGVVYYNGHKETWYSEKRLPGERLNIPGRHVASDGTIRDEDGYIVVAAASDYMSKGTTLMTTLGPAKVYDTARDYGIIDIYVNWEI